MDNLEKEDLKPNINSSNLNKIIVIAEESCSMLNKIDAFLKSLHIKAIYAIKKQESLKPISQIYNKNKETLLALIILNADCFSYPRRNGTPNDAVMKSDQRIIFALGYWLAKLGRDKVIALYYDQKSYRRPTEFFDVFYIPFDKKSLWQNELKIKLKDSGFNI